MKKLTFIATLFTAAIFASCGGDSGKTAEEQTTETETTTADPESYDPKRGQGITETLDVAKAESGQKAFDVKCSSCHKLSEEKLVGPGWLGVTKRRTPVWIMNFITNTDAMIDKDPAVQAQLEICLVRMPNQSLSDDEARGLLEFMRKNDGIK
jgi:cytochrome c2